MADNEVQIDSLSVAIEHSASTASKDLSSLASGLRKLQKSVTGLNLNNAIIQFGSLSTAIGGIGNNADKITALASSLLDLKSVGKVSAAVPKSLSNQISALDTALSGVTESDVKRISSLASALTQLSGAKMPQISASIGHQLQSIGDAAKNLQGVNLARFKDLATALQPLSALTPAHLTSFTNQLGKFTQLSKDLEAVDMDKFAATIERLTAAMAPLATEMDKIARGFSAFPQRIQTFIKNNEAATSSVKKSKKEMGGWQGTLGKILGQLEKIEKKPSIFKKLLSAAAFSKIKSIFDDTVESANEYIEALNLFYVSMGSYAKKAQSYAELVGDSYGVDPAEFMKMQAVFMDVSKSFGTASGTAYTMSKALTQLTYDISSLYNLKVDESLNKVRSALVGEIEPIRALGKDLSVANLKLLATELGITANVDAMNQSEKAMLRTISLLRQSNSAMGDMARTLEQPANQFRILKAQLTLLGRAIGDLFLPLVQKTLPYMIAFVKVGQRIVSAFAALAGFELPKFDYADSVIQGNEGVADSADDAAKSMKKLYQLSFDELNILGSQNSSSSGTGMSAADLAKLEAELNRLAKLEDDMFSKNLGETTDKIAAEIEDWLTKGEGIEKWASDVYETFKDIKDAAESISKALGLWDVDADLATNLDNIWQKLKAIGIALLVIFIAKSIIGLVNEISKVKSFTDKLKDLRRATKKVTDAMDDKNKKLKKQTEETADETEAVGELSPKLDTATSAITAMAGAIPAIGINWNDAWQTVTNNSLSFDVDTSQIVTADEQLSEFVGSSFYQLNEWLVDSADAMSVWQATLSTLTDETTSKVNSSWQTAFDTLNTNAVNGFNDILASSDSFGESIFSSMVDPIKQVDSEYATTFNNIYSNYARLMESMGMEAAPYSAGTSSANASYVKKSSKIASKRTTSSMVLFGEEENSTKTKSKSTGQEISKADSAKNLLEEFEKVYKRFDIYDTTNGTLLDQWKKLPDKFKNAGESFAKNAEYVLDKTLELLKNILGMSSSFGMVPAFATGGFPEDGMFYANSGELVGRFSNGRTAVANNAQIIEGIENAVYRAMTAAQRGSGRGGKIELILDKQVVGRAFGDAIDSEKRRSGANTKITFTNGGTR